MFLLALSEVLSTPPVQQELQKVLARILLDAQHEKKIQAVVLTITGVEYLHMAT